MWPREIFVVGAFIFTFTGLRRLTTGQLLHFEEMPMPGARLSSDEEAAEKLLAQASPFQYDDYSPVIFMNGLGGSRAYVAVSNRRTYPPHLASCAPNSPRHFAWMTRRITGDPCELYWLSLELDGDAVTSLRNVSVSMLESRFGQIEAVECLTAEDPTWLLCELWKSHDNGYAHRMFDEMQQWGYQREVDQFAATYDFRFEPYSDSLLPYYRNLTSLIERVVRETGKRVVLVGHSNGNIVLAHYVRSMSKEWVEVHIGFAITLSAPFGGAVTALFDVMTGEPLGVWPIFYMDAPLVRDLTRTFGSVATNLPLPNGFDDDVVASIDGRLYTAGNITELLHLFSCNSTAAVFAHYTRMPHNRLPPIPFHCLYGTRVETLARVDYTGGKPTLHHGPGDGTVNAKSLQMCNTHPNATVKAFPGVGHTAILRNDRVLDYLAVVLRNHSRVDATVPDLLTRVLHDHADGIVCYSRYPLRSCGARESKVSANVIAPFVCFPDEVDVLRSDAPIHHFTSAYYNDYARAIQVNVDEACVPKGSGGNGEK